MADYIAELAALTDEEQEIYRLERLDPDDRLRLAEIEHERARLWNLERARRVGLDESSVPTGGWQIDRPSGWAAYARNRSASALPHATLRLKGRDYAD